MLNQETGQKVIHESALFYEQPVNNLCKSATDAGQHASYTPLPPPEKPIVQVIPQNSQPAFIHQALNSTLMPQMLQIITDRKTNSVYLSNQCHLCSVLSASD